MNGDEDETGHFAGEMNVMEIGRTLAGLGDKLNEEGGRHYEYLAIAALGIALTFATLSALKLL